MYYDYPKAEEAYNFKNQYMFGNDILMTPVTQPIGKDSLFVQKEIWLPEGEWIEMVSGSLLKGGRIIQRAFTMDEIPVYVKSGAIIPMQPQKAANSLILNIFPGKSGVTKVYDDEGNTNNYKTGAYSFTEINFNMNNDHKMKVMIEPIQGSYPGMPESRVYEIRLPLRFPPETVTVNGQAIHFQADGKANSWNFNGNELTTQIFSPEFSVHQKVEVEIQFPNYDFRLLSDKKGQIARLIKFMKFLAKNNWDKSKYSNDSVVHAAQTGHRITINPQNTFSEIRAFESEWQKVLEMIEACSMEKPEYHAYLELLKTFAMQK